ncbi:MAG: hypothetical protein JWN34_2087 [Bryobacterales bacterium]|nr:hypothetical protein [Bryobacterales bacterium]
MLFIDDWFAIRCLPALKQERVLLTSNGHGIQRDHAPQHQAPAPQIPDRRQDAPFSGVDLVASARTRLLRCDHKGLPHPHQIPVPLRLHSHGHGPGCRVHARARTESKQETGTAVWASHVPCLLPLIVMVVLGLCDLWLHSDWRLLMTCCARPAGASVSARKRPVGMRLAPIRLFIGSSLLTKVLTNARVILTPSSPIILPTSLIRP